MEDDVHWSEVAAEKLIKEKGNKDLYICASGISPSGTVHIGNFREVITTALVVKALERKGKKTKFIFSWDDFDRFRKVPQGIPPKFEEYLGLPYTYVPDPFNCHKSYAEHYEKEFENSIKDFGFDIKFISQTKKYENCDYAEGIKQALNNVDKIKEIYSRFRVEQLEDDWLPITVYCEKCHKDFTKVLSYHKKYQITYDCHT